MVAYDDAGGAIAARLWWMLRWTGHSEAALLDGGFAAWQASGQALETGEPAPRTAMYHGCSNDEACVSSDDVAAALSAGSMLLLDAREAPRFRGEQEPIDEVAGHIPGAINVPFQENLDADGYFLPAAEIGRRFRQIIGRRPVDTVACMCGSGVTACHNLFAMELAGLPGARLYTGSWSEWIRSGLRPVATGD